MAGRESERVSITDFVSTFLQPSSSTVAPSILYISGSPGTGKTALVNNILGSLRDELENAEISVVTVNCMALNNIDALLEQLIEHFRSAEESTKKGARARKPKISTMQILNSLFSQAARRW